jgi:hypothetical protein
MSLTLISFCLLPTSLCWSKSTTAKMTSVEKNVQRLLKTNSCIGCDLTGADLRQRNLAKANLNGANLSGAKLNLADLSGASLQQTILFETDLSGADLSFADLNEAEFRSTIFEGAHFEHTQLKGQTVNRLIHTEQAQLEVFESAPPKELIIALESTPTAAPVVEAAPVVNSPPVPIRVNAPPAPVSLKKYVKAAIKPTPMKKQAPLRLFPSKIAMAPYTKLSAPAAGISAPKKVAALEKEHKQAR